MIMMILMLIISIVIPIVNILPMCISLSLCIYIYIYTYVYRYRHRYICYTLKAESLQTTHNSVANTCYVFQQLPSGMLTEDAVASGAGPALPSRGPSSGSSGSQRSTPSEQMRLMLFISHASDMKINLGPSS